MTAFDPKLPFKKSSNRPEAAASELGECLGNLGLFTRVATNIKTKNQIRWTARYVDEGRVILSHLPYSLIKIFHHQSCSLLSKSMERLVFLH